MNTYIAIYADVFPFREDFVRATQSFVRSIFLPPSNSAMVESILSAMSSTPLYNAIGGLEVALGYFDEKSNQLGTFFMQALEGE